VSSSIRIVGRRRRLRPLRAVASALLSLAALSPAPLFAQDRVRDLVVKIHAVRRTPDLLRPWTKLNPVQVSGSGVVIEGKRILTNAHVVQYATQIYVQPNQSADRLAAEVVAIAPGIDLALLRLEDESFFERRGFLPFARELPGVKQTVNVYGYPTGGSELSVTEGIVSRIEYADYYYFTMGLRIQVDAPLNSGNSGGPAVAEGKLVGVVFSRIRNAQNIGYLIPVEEIELFLEDVRDGRYDGKPQMYDSFQTVENDALRAKLGLPKGMGGLVVMEPYRKDPDYPLAEWDVITHIGEHAVDKEGKVAVRYDLRLSALYLVQRLARNGSVALTIFRDGQSRKVEAPVQRRRELVVPYLLDGQPRYFIYGPLVFSTATQDYIDRLGSQWELSLARQGTPLIARRYDRPRFEDEEIVVVCAPMFPHRITRGYDDPNAAVVEEVNGVRIRNLRQMVELLRDTRAPHVVFKFARAPGRMHETLVFDREEIAAATEEVLNENGIRYPYSEDIRQVWENRGVKPAGPRATGPGMRAVSDTAPAGE
jgi:S1-C subfamily serine protease